MKRDLGDYGLLNNGDFRRDKEMKKKEILVSGYLRHFYLHTRF